MGGISCAYRPVAARMIELEILSWPVDNSGHNLEINDLRRGCVDSIPHFNVNLSLCKVQCDNGGLDGFWHYFITDGVYVLEFGDECWSGKKEPNFTVLIHSNPPKTYLEEKTFEKTSIVAQRMADVCGAVGYSLCFRNSEHVTRYVCNGVWTCAQMLPGAVVMRCFEPHMSEHHLQLVNTKPHELVKRKAQQCLYPDIQPFITYERSPLALDKQDEAFNIVFLGPTGCGKSHLVNQYFNKTVSLSAGSAESVTRDVQIFTGTAMLASPPTSGQAGTSAKWAPLHHDWHLERKRVNVVDTIGLCDSALPAIALQDLIKQKLKGNFIYIDRVVIVCAGRIELGHQQAILQFMKWLDFNRYASNFTFVYNKADTLDEEEREQNLFQMCKLLKTGDVVRSCNESLLPTSSLLRTASPQDASEEGSVRSCDKQPPRDISEDGDSLPPATGKQRQVCNRYALGFRPKASYAEVERDLGNLLNATLGPIDAQSAAAGQRIRLSEESCSIL